MPDYGTFGAPAVVSTTRTDKLFSQCQLTLATVGETKLKDVINYLPEAVIYDKLDEAQHQIASDLLCIEKSGTLTMSSGSASEPSGFYRLKQIVLPTSQTVQPIEVTASEYDDIIRKYTTNTGQSPIFYWRWAGSIKTYPNLSDGSYTVYYFGVPTTTIAYGTEPETPTYMDRALLFWAVKECAMMVGRADLATMYDERYDRERSSCLKRWRGTKTPQLVIEPGDYI